MTIRHLSEVRPADPPRRSGEPWTDDDYSTLVTLCREGLDLTETSHRLGRSPQSVRDRARRMLPLEQRGVPGDRVLTQLRTNLLPDPDYDWQRHLATPQPPRPIIRQVLPAPTHAGFPGLEDDELLATADALAQQRRPAEDYLAQALAHEVRRRGLAADLGRAGELHARERVEDFLDRADYPYRPTDCWAMTGPSAADTSGTWRDDEPPW
ncbi:hypothetical protein SGUI_2980 [Serinicoccus hydrothermalis]|uniref:Uncharacterized protein n=1 Tax=Serinicoccus hydrothermalis TaxID=1758689 RepID=A0A1B1NG14_9MICO|nr:hypothetical protein [Serinicoccus hydrothermalis]ANS80376.1 hypothetical protein SGUI_2980 [Serinicoccus hydrothermalis]